MNRVKGTAVLLTMSIIALGCSTQPEGPEIKTMEMAASTGGTSYVLVFKGNGIPSGAAGDVAAAGGTVLLEIPEIGVLVASSGSATFASKAGKIASVSAVSEQRLQALPTSAGVTPTSSTPTGTSPTPFFWGFQWDMARIGADKVWNTTTGSSKTVVAIIDTGVAWNHPDLAPNMVFAACASVTGVCNPYPSFHWHGTHVAGTVAGAGLGMAGVGPDLALASYNVFEASGGAYDGPIWWSMVDAAKRGFKVINMSLGGYVVKPRSKEDVATWTAWNRVANYARNMGVTIVAASGNDGFNLNGPVSHIPADLPGVISVGATGIRPAPIFPFSGSSDVVTDYSNTGASVTLVAPGGDAGPASSAFPWYYYLVFSSYVLANPFCATTYSCTPAWAWAGGTSMASPHVAGAAGLLVDSDPNLNPNKVEAILKSTADKMGKRAAWGHGLLNVPAALAN